MTTVPCLDEQPSSVQCLYPEILAEAFKFCLSPENRIGIKYAPLLLCNVCSSWRAITISTPLLWTIIYLSSTSLRNRNTGSIVKGIHTWLRRSGTLPLTIRLHFDVWGLHVDNAFQVCDALSKYASRWEYLDVLTRDIPFSSWPTLNTVPLLSTLRINSDFDGLPFNSLPNLTRVTFKLSARVTKSTLTRIPWHQLVEVEILQWQKYDQVLELITWCPLLEYLKVAIEDREGDVNVEPAVRNLPIEHTVLKNIHICSLYDYSAFLETLTVPALKSLSLYEVMIHDENREYSRGYSNLMGLFNRSHCKLQKLSLHNCSFSVCQLLKSLEHRSCRTLTSLYIHARGLDKTLDNDNLLLRLTCIEDKVEEFFLTELTHLGLLSNCIWKSSPGLVGRMIASRLSKGGRNGLEWFHYSYASLLSAEDDWLLERAKEAGLRMCILKR